MNSNILEIFNAYKVFLKDSEEKRKIYLKGDTGLHHYTIRISKLVCECGLCLLMGSEPHQDRRQNTENELPNMWQWMRNCERSLMEKK